MHNRRIWPARPCPWLTHAAARSAGRSRVALAAGTVLVLSVIAASRPTRTPSSATSSSPPVPCHRSSPRAFDGSPSSSSSPAQDPPTGAGRGGRPHARRCRGRGREGRRRRDPRRAQPDAGGRQEARRGRQEARRGRSAAPPLLRVRSIVPPLGAGPCSNAPRVGAGSPQPLRHTAVREPPHRGRSAAPRLLGVGPCSVGGGGSRGGGARGGGARGGGGTRGVGGARGGGCWPTRAPLPRAARAPPMSAERRAAAPWRERERMGGERRGR
ncbi:hypothetical protein PVAP13_1NG250719 [Panicum virgatum]|uniref:Uncharacterized protein n=1 Tax=Panicum virgatum TaxID=38727 RepID=A0A8T0WNJ1_PANVG|nr:hypothetical protein PVAP13_1NG250719 [Panicum virgatum]